MCSSDLQLHQVRKPQLFAGSCGSASGQHPKRFQIRGWGAHGGQIRIEKALMAHLVVGVVMNILRKIPIDSCQATGVGSAPAAAWNLVVLNSAKLVILCPKVDLEGLSRGQEPQDRGISCREAAA